MSGEKSNKLRIDVLTEQGSSQQEQEELLRYNQNLFWKEQVSSLASFPIKEGISQSDAYLSATRRRAVRSSASLHRPPRYLAGDRSLPASSVPFRRGERFFYTATGI